MLKKVISTLIAADMALGCITCGIKTAEERTLATMAEIEQRIDDANTWQQHTVKTRQEKYIKDSLGAFSLTFYVPDSKWGYQTSTGVRSEHLATCAVDPKVIPYGSVIRITGNNGQVLTLRCVDCGDFSGKKIDIFWDGSVSSGYDWIARFGTVHNVYLLEE